MNARVARMRLGLLCTLVSAAFAVALILAPRRAEAQTTIVGGNIINQTWSPAGSPYIIQGDVTVPAGAYLTINAGTVVQFASTDMQAAGLNTTRVELTVNGTLTVAGAAGNPVTFTGQTASPGSWYGLVIGATSPSASIANATIQYAINGITNNSVGPALAVNDTQIRNTSASGVSVAAGTPTFTNLQIATTSTGISVTSSASPTFTGGSITGASSTAISVTPSAASTSVFTGLAVSGSASYGLAVSTTTAASVVVNVSQCTFHQNGNYGVYVYGSSSVNVAVRNSIVTQQAYGVYRSTSAGFPVVNVTYSDVWGNTTADYTSVSAGTGTLAANPLYVSASNLRLTSNSPARFAGDTMADVGALAYVSDATPGLYGTLWTDTHLTAAGSPYTVAGDLTVGPGVTLTIDPGVTLLFTAGSDIMGSGTNTTRGELRVFGALAAGGAAAQPIVFTSTTSAAGSWYGIELYSTTTAPTLTYASITGSTVGLTYAGTTADTIANLTISAASATGISTTAGSPTFSNVNITGASTGILVSASASPTFTGGTIANATSTAVSISPSAASTTTLTGLAIYASASYGIAVSTTTAAAVNVNVTNCSVHQNGNYGVYVYGSSSVNVSVRNSIVTQQAYGVYRSTSAGFPVVNVTYSDVWGNTTADYTSVSAGTGTQTANPLYVSNTNLRLTVNSPARFAGDTMADIGALPYVSDPTPGLYGTLWTNTRLAVAGSPYSLAGDLTVAPGVTLTIDPGVTLTFVAGSDIMGSGTNTTRGELRINGALAASGTSATPIVLTSSTGAPGSWYGVEFMSTASAPTLTFANIIGATVGITYAGTTTDTLTDLTISACSATGISTTAGAPTFTRVTISGSSTGVSVTSASSPTFTDLTVANSSSTGVSITPSAASTTTLVNAVIASSASYGVAVSTTSGAAVNVSLTNCTIHANGNYGVYVYGSSSVNTTVVNSIVTQQAYGVYRSTSAGFPVVNVSYSDVWGNTTANYTSVSAGAGCFSQNPLYVSAPGNLHLQSGSVAIDVGTATGAPNHDRDGVTRPINGDGINGAEFDVGAYEFYLMAACGNGVREGTEVCDDGARNGTYGACNAACTALGPRCGDGTVNGPETCDDANSSNTDACLNTCVSARCGDGFVLAGTETCDDGNASNTDACLNTCVAARCGDGFVLAGGETCDDGNTSNTDACLNTCATARCGDGFVLAGTETCDDANTDNTDACTSLCQAARCGDGFVRAGTETCDDGNAINTDACLDTCVAARCGDGFVRAGVETCDDGNASNTDACTGTCQAARCGDGFVQAGVETCDDGANNGTAGFCNATCTAGAGPRCGNGVREGTEQCDDGNASNTDACLNTCASATCNDGFVQSGVEVCDDGNTSNADSCLTTCQNASCGDGFLHSGVELCDEGSTNGTYGHCSATCNGPGPRCGDGTTNGPEECDDGNASNTDACLNTCVNARCGDAIVRAGTETCDDGNNVDTDSCTNACVPARCGDGIVQMGTEFCDDGNILDGDGCSATCMRELVDAGTDGGEDVADATDATDATDAVDAIDASDDADAASVSDVAEAGDVVSDVNVRDAASDASDTGGDAGNRVNQGGCGCRTAGRSGHGGALAWLVAAALVARGLRRRRAKG